MPDYKKQWADNLINEPEDDKVARISAKMNAAIASGYWFSDEDWVQLKIAEGYDEAFVRKFFKELSEDLKR
jgi:hypothetical protein